MRFRKLLCALLSAALSLSLLMPASLAEGTATAEIYTGVFGDVRVQILSPTLVRLEARGPKGFEDRETFHIVNRTDWPGAAVTEARAGGTATLTCENFEIRIAENAKTLSDVVILRSGGRNWNFTSLPENKVALPDPNEAVDFFEIADTPRIIPSEEGFAPSESTDNNGWDLSNDADDLYIFMPDAETQQAASRQLRQDFVDLTGKSEMLPLQAFGAWDSRWYAYNEETALAQIDSYHDRELPLDMLVIDTDWRDSSGGTGYNINTSLFPDMSSFLNLAHRKGVGIMFNDHPEPTTTNGVSNNVLDSTELNYRFSNLTNILKLGVDAWWYDRNWWTTIQPIEGFTHEVIGAAVYADAFHSVYPERRLLMMSNVDGILHGALNGPANIAAHRYSIEWTGDTEEHQGTILREVTNMLKRGTDAAIPYVSADLCAHQTQLNTMTEKEYIRWIQFGVFSPVFRPHVTYSEIGRMPWYYGDGAVDAYRDYVNMRYRLLPVFYALSNESYNTGMPIFREMTFDYPEYAEADREDQYLLGDDILIAPVVEDIDSLPTAWLTAEDGTPGATVRYYNNKDLSGTPVKTGAVSEILIEAEKNAPAEGVSEDNFSAAYTARLTPEADIRLQLMSDDGSRLYINGELAIDSWSDHEVTSAVGEITLEAGKTYDLRVEYYDAGGNAVLRLNALYADDFGDRRSVWIPEGEWIDLNSGKSYYGPATYEISCTIEDYPIFVRSGAVVPLADETLTTADSGYDWSHMTLDLYPSATQEGQSVIYEDDTTSNAYEDGAYRTTSLSTRFEAKSNTQILTIGAADGGFEGKKAFTERNWTVRIHAADGLGALQSVTINGEAADFTLLETDGNALPFEVEGGAADGAVYTVTFTADISQESEIRAVFSAGGTVSPNYRYEEKSALSTARTVTRTVDLQEAAASVDLSADSTDWVYVGHAARPSRFPGIGTIAMKETDRHSIRFSQIGANLMIFSDCLSQFSWSDGDALFPTAVNTRRGYNNNQQDGYYEVILDADAGENEAHIFMGVWKAKAVLEVFDDTGAAVDRFEIENRDASTLKDIVVRYTADGPAKLHVRCTLDTKYESGGNNTFVAAYVRRISEPTDYTEPFRLTVDSDCGDRGVQNGDIRLAFSANREVEGYLVRTNNGPWQTTDNGCTIWKNGVNNLEVCARFADGSLSTPTLYQAERTGRLTGDSDENGSLTVSDVVALRQLIVAGTSNKEEIAASDLTGDEALTVSDVIELRQRIIG